MKYTIELDGRELSAIRQLLNGLIGMHRQTDYGLLNDDMYEYYISAYDKMYKAKEAREK